MEQVNYQASDETPSLLILNDDCLIAILTFLRLDDYVNLAKTCWRLLCVAQGYKKYRHISSDDVSYTVEEFSNILSVIGEHVESTNIASKYGAFHKTIAENCPNLKRVQLINPNRGSLPFRNLKELTVLYDVRITTDDWINFFKNNPGIENLECIKGTETFCTY